VWISASRERQPSFPPCRGGPMWAATNPAPGWFGPNLGSGPALGAALRQRYWSGFWAPASIGSTCRVGDRDAVGSRRPAGSRQPKVQTAPITPPLRSAGQETRHRWRLSGWPRPASDVRAQPGRHRANRAPLKRADLQQHSRISTEGWSSRQAIRQRRLSAGPPSGCCECLRRTIADIWTTLRAVDPSHLAKPSTTLV